MALLKFPHDLSGDYFFALGFETYTRPDPFSSLMKLYPAANSHRIYLPIPQNVINRQNLGWETGNAFIGDVAAKSYEALTSSGGWTDVATRLGIAGSLGIAEGIVQRVGQIFNQGAMADGALQSILQAVGLAQNPVTSVMFNAPEFKVHSFEWKMIADTPEESETIKQIIENIRYESLPDVALNGMFFTYPSIARIKIMTREKELYSFQPAVITSVEVNYAANPGQVPSFFAKTGEPTEVSLQISLLEIIMNTRRNTKNDGSIALNVSNSVPGWTDTSQVAARLFTNGIERFINGR